MEGPASTSSPARTTNSADGGTAHRDALEGELMTLWGHINAATFRFLELLAEFDREEFWNGAGITSCAHWLNVFCGIGTVAAREKVRVARALESLPQISEAFRRGEISYSKVRAMTRIATPAIEENLLMIARHGTASHMARLVRHFRTVERRDEAEQAQAIRRERFLRTYHDEDGTLVLQARLPAEVGALIVRAIEAAMALEERAQHTAAGASAEAPDTHCNAQSPDRGAAAARSRSAGSESRSRGAAADAQAWGADDDTQSLGACGDAQSLGACGDAQSLGASAEAPAEAIERPDDSVGARRADALALLAERFLADEARHLPSAGDRYQVVVHVDQTLLCRQHDPDDPLQICELEEGPRLALETARRLACDGCLVGIVEAADGTPLDVGRKTRAVPLPLKRALAARDRGCRFPGCERHRRTHAHHIEHWADGGATKLDNLVTLCAFHHRLLHEGGFGVTIDADGELLFTRPDGTSLLDRIDHMDRLGRIDHTRSRGSAATGLADGSAATGLADGSAATGRPDGSAATALADADREIADLIAMNASFGTRIDAGTARSRWQGEPMDYSMAVERMYFDKHGRV